jgi:4-amino-4-deoxy-L-arabinose transferase-like glycosyltransferase
VPPVHHAPGQPRWDAIFLLILAAALGVRLYLALTAPYIHDEINTSIPLSKQISFTLGNMHLPLRGENHGALPAYVVKASSTLFGTTPLAYRALHILLALCTIALIHGLTREWYGVVAARWAAALFAFNEYYLGISFRATAHVPYLFFMTAAAYAFSRFLRVERAAYLYLAAAAVGLAFYCKEHAVLLLPVFLLTLLGARYRSWLRRPEPYVACALFILSIVPDVAWNVRTQPETAFVTYSGRPLAQATYRAHLQRIGGIGFSPYPLVFWARSAVVPLYQMVTGRELGDVTTEYRSINPALGVLLFGALVLTTVRASRSDAVRGFLLVMAWLVFGVFTVIAKGDAPYRLASVNWVWVESMLIPVSILAGARLAGVRPKWRGVVWIFAVVVLLYAIDSVALESPE